MELRNKLYLFLLLIINTVGKYLILQLLNNTSTLTTGPAASIGCFVCFSIDRSNQGCEDTFHYNISYVEYQETCLTNRKGRTGLYPASSCIKLSGQSGAYQKKLQSVSKQLGHLLPFIRVIQKYSSWVCNSGSSVLPLYKVWEAPKHQQNR